MSRFVSLFLIFVFLAGAQMPTQDQRLQWWREARFGMFIHWGLYAVPAGEWKGQRIPGIGEWIMNRAKIPVAEYEQLAKRFNPVKFDAEQFAKLAKDAGQKYLVITSKHHDGFAMFHSKVSPYNVVDATPFRRDIIGELAKACQRHGIKLCFYYSQAQDWHDPDGWGNNWDFDNAKKDYEKYLARKARPQVRELLTQYGPIGLIWYDTPMSMTKEQSIGLRDLVHQIQPMSIVSGRVGNDVGDYRSAGDNEIPVRVLDYDWETPVTLNDTWGYKSYDTNWKPTQQLIRQLVDVVSKNGNYLLNVGPTAEGIIPEGSAERLREMGRWLSVNGEAVYGAKPSPFPYEFDWGSITAKPGKLYVHLIDWPRNGEFVLYGLKNRVKKAFLLSDKKPLQVKSGAELHVQLPKMAPDKVVSVLALEIEGAPEVAKGLTQQPDGRITLSTVFAERAPQSKLNIDNRGIVRNWMAAGESLKWQFAVKKAGSYDVVALSTESRSAGLWQEADWAGGHEVKVIANGNEWKATLKDDGRFEDPRSPHWKDVRSVIGRVELKPGPAQLSFEPTKINAERKLGLRLRKVQLVPAGQ